jgi:hypothetical protein
LKSSAPRWKRAIHAAGKKGADAMKVKEWTDAERQRSSGRLKRRIIKTGPGQWVGKEWTPAQLTLLGTDHDEAIAKRIGRTLVAVRSQRTLRKIPAFSGWPGGGPGWTSEELALLGTMPDAKLAERINRTRRVVARKRFDLDIPAYSGWTGGSRAWTEEDVALLGSDHDDVIAKKIGRTRNACALQRSLRDIPTYSGLGRGQHKRRRKSSCSARTLKRQSPRRAGERSGR